MKKIGNNYFYAVKGQESELRILLDVLKSGKKVNTIRRNVFNLLTKTWKQSVISFDLNSSLNM